MKFRAVASVALAAALAGGLAGCNLISPLATTIEYAASDGVHVTVGDLELRNIMILVDAEGDTTPTAGSFVGTIVNHADDAGSVTITTESATAQLPLDASQPLTHIGYGDGPQVLIEGVQLEPGSTIDVTFTGPGGTTETKKVPVLDGTLAEYSTLLPQAPEPTPTLPAPTATPGAEGNATGTFEGDAQGDAQGDGLQP
ncbi:hypothetical protein GCM10011490_11710 [Pseudoclavibacter endophyticus]|uniref:DNA modification methylase n=1 Tax=Pseudoclavibacter endophyticus TaxID=1778590 RepID=A0A6H9WMW6_9MICO|nr:hypothetical protein [Pseudoclavibacter endophyticus]KAB1649408.1 hypothetical protein F8O04_03835 [Pseudoclavibacter endophyticus]GGA62884.1 hypothetical protein GCM10011490_11710 [Pseudoclavibacter endophyticus]